MHKDNGDNVAIIFIVSSLKKGTKEYNRYKMRICDLELDDQILLYDKVMNFPALVMQADLVLRLTYTDGDALTVREGLWLGVNVLASDVVERPAGCYTFKNRSLGDLYKREIEVLARTSISPPRPNIDYLNWYLDLYKGKL